MMELAYLQTVPKQTALLKAEFADFVVKEKLGYDFSGEGEFVVVKVRKTNANTIFVGEKLAEFAGISARNMSYAGLKDRHGVTEQWFSLHMPGKTTPDFSQFHVEGVEILAVSRHQRKIRIGSLQGNYFEILLRNAVESDELKVRLKNLAFCGFPNYFMDQRFGHDGQNLMQALRWAKGEIQVKDRKKRSFYLSAARSEVFNLIVSARIQQGDIQRVLPKDIVQLRHSQRWFVVDENEDLAGLQQRLRQNDIVLTAALIGDNMPPTNCAEMQIIQQHSALLHLMKQERVKPMRRAMLMFAEDFTWAFNPQGLALRFFLPAGSYATALIRELVKTV